MYNIGICDDGKNICSAIEEMVFAYAKENSVKVEVDVWYTGESLCDYLKWGNQIDILFLDIELFELTGIEVGNYIRSELENRGMQIIYISGKTSYALELFKTQPLDFLVKPLEQKQIDEALELAIKVIGKNAGKFKFQSGKDYYYVPYGEIMYFSSEGKKIKLITQENTREFYGKLKEIINLLPEEFIVIHQSYVVNKLHVVKYEYDMVELIDGIRLPISKSNRKKIRQEILHQG